MKDVCKVRVDWLKIMSKEDFYDQVLLQCDSLSWHGRNLNALNDAWVGGDIVRNGPPYWFIFENRTKALQNMKDFVDDVHEIARASVDENGGIYEEVE